MKSIDEKETELVNTINQMIALCKPIDKENFNVKIFARNIEELDDAEESNNKIGVTDSGISTFSLIATITDILIGKRLAFIIDEFETIQGVCFYDKTV